MIEGTEEGALFALGRDSLPETAGKRLVVGSFQGLSIVQTNGVKEGLNEGEGGVEAGAGNRDGEI